MVSLPKYRAPSRPVNFEFSDSAQQERACTLCDFKASALPVGSKGRNRACQTLPHIILSGSGPPRDPPSQDS